MCHSSDAYNALSQGGALKTLPSVMHTIINAQIRDVKELHESCAEIANVQKENVMRMTNIEKNIAEVKEKMVTKAEFNEFKESLTQAVRDAAKFNLVRDVLKSPKAWILFLIFCGALMGARYLDYITNIAH